MKQDSLIAVLIATGILILGIILGFTNLKINLRIMHTLIGLSFLIIVASGLKIHYNRLIYKSPYNMIAWLHFVIFSIFLYLAITMIRKWNRRENFEEKFIVKYKGEEYNIKDFIPKHPGGKVIKRSKNKDLEKVWEMYGVEWHKKNKKVQKTLNKYKIK